MSERISKLILETEFRTTGDIAPDVQKIEQLRKGVQSATGDTLKLIEAEKKLEQASIQAGVAVDNQSKKQSEFNKTVQQGSKALTDLGQTNKLKEAFAGGSEIKNVTDLLKAFEAEARKATSIDELAASVDNLVNSLPDDLKADAIKTLDKEMKKLDKTIQSPVAELRELKKLIAQETDPKILKKLNERAGELKDQIGDTNDLINALASDTFYTDTLVEGATTAVSAFTAFQGALSLVTDDQEELAKAAQKAQGALALLQGTQTLLNELKKSDNIITRSQIVLQRAYAAVVGESVGVTKGLRVALASTGIGLLVVAIGALASNWDRVKVALGGANEEQKRQEALTRKAAESIAAETSQIEIAKAKLQDSNLTQKERVEIIQDLQKQYPNYLSNINAETAGYEELEKALNNVSNALFIKAGIQAREQELIDLQKRLIELERLGVDASTGTTEAILSFAAAAATASTIGIEDAFNAADAALQANFEIEKKTVEDQINTIIKEIIDSNRQLTALGGDPSRNAQAAKKSADNNKKLIEGTIAYFEARVSGLAKKLNEDLVAGSEEFFSTKDKWLEATKQLAEARKLLETPSEIVVFTEGSLNALNKQAQDLQQVINNLGLGSELEQRAAELREVQKHIKEIQDVINGPQDDQKKIDDIQKLNFDLLNEEERHQLAMLQIEERGEQARLKTQLTYAKERLKILQESGTATEAELEQAKNAVTELEAELNKSQAKFNKEFVNKVVDGFKLIVTEAFNATKQILALKQEEVDGLRRLQEQRVEDARAIADKGNAAVLKAEEERLAKLDEQSRKYARQQIALTQLQITAQSALAIAKAAAEGGVAAPFTIAATLIALAVGYAQARAQASQIGTQSFKKGGYFDGGFTGNGNPNEVSTAQGPRPYEYHKGEYIHNAQVTAIGKNREWFEQIRLKRLDLDKLFHKQNPVVIVNNDSSKVVEAIQRIPATRLSVDKNGVFRIVESTMNTERKRQSIKRRGK